MGSEYAALGHNQDVVPIQFFSIATGKGVRQLWGHTARVNRLAPTAEGRYLLSGGNDQVLHIWDISQHKRLPQDRPLRPLLSLFVAEIRSNRSGWSGPRRATTPPRRAARS